MSNHVPHAIESAHSPTRHGEVGRSAGQRWALIALLLLAIPAQAADYDTAFKSFQTGDYETALAATESMTKEYLTDVRWWRLRLECLSTLGRYREGADQLKIALRRHYVDGPIRVLGYEILRQNGEPQEARAVLAELLRIASYSPWQFRSADDRVWVGRAATLMGADARQVLEQFYDQALKLNPDLRDVYLATGELALLKHDQAVAAENFRAALKKLPDDPDLLCGLAQALDNDSPREATAALRQALAINPRHLASLFVTAEEAIGHEDYRDARAALDKILAINGNHPRAWALRAVLAHLHGDLTDEQLCRQAALCAWDTNPDVDHIIGQKLSSAYRFAEGAAYQRRSLEMDPQYLPARTQLAQDLLRLGESDKGWQLVSEVQSADEYNVVAFNLATLHDHLTNYTTLESPHFLLSMDRREAAVYGPRVMALLERARQTLGEKYGYESQQRVTVEILNRQKDFAIRTFGLPGGDGILGVCFGPVITANSPAALAGSSTNWEATLWHEYCHVVTLELTHHRIPRWLSEGISVYEERQANPTWGNRLNHDTRRMILDGELVRVGELNQAFRNPKSGAHFNLAYYEASLAVEFLVERLGHATLRRILLDVAAGMPINTSLEIRTGSLAGFESAFDEYARRVAHNFGPTIDWSERDLPPLPQGPASAVAEWLKDRPRHYLGRLRYAQALMAEKQWQPAEDVLAKLVDAARDWAGDDSPYTLLAEVHREQQETDAERAVLEASAARSDSSTKTYHRLIELAVAAKDWKAVEMNVERYLAVQPLDEFPYRHAAAAGEQGGNLAQAVVAARALLALEPADRAGAHYLLAKLLHATHDASAKRHALLALEETPRFRDAQRLLLEIVMRSPNTKEK